MKRDFAAIGKRTFDLIVVGGGVYGICAAREAAMQGLSVCLLERNDFGAATSSNSLKIIHGGLRYLQNMDIRRMRESIRERRAMHRMAPHLVRPMPFVIPCYGHALRGREVLAGALAANELISADRNIGVIEERRIPAGRLISRKKLVELVPGLPEPGCVGGAIWYDGQARNTERLMIAFLESANAAGASTFNHVEVTDFLRNRTQVSGVRCRDQITDHEFDVRGTIVLNAAGPWVDELLGKLNLSRTGQLFVQSKGINLVTRQIFCDHAAAIPFQEEYTDRQAVLDKSRLHFFIVPWKRYSLIGTRHLPWTGDPDEFSARRVDVQRFVAEINRAYPPANLDLSDVCRVYQGILPALPGDDGADVQISKQYVIVDHERADALKGVISVVGVKWTTARDVAARSIAVVLKKLGRKPVVKRTDRALPAGAFASWKELLTDMARVAESRFDSGLLERLAESHGLNAIALLRSLASEPELGTVIEGGDGSPTLVAEIFRAVGNEQACCLEDIVLRRTELAIGGRPGNSTLETVAELAGRVLDWSPQQRHRQIEATEKALDELRV